MLFVTVSTWPFSKDERKRRSRVRILLPFHQHLQGVLWKGWWGVGEEQLCGHIRAYWWCVEATFALNHHILGLTESRNQRLWLPPEQWNRYPQIIHHDREHCISINSCRRPISLPPSLPSHSTRICRRSHQKSLLRQQEQRAGVEQMWNTRRTRHL